MEEELDHLRYWEVEKGILELENKLDLKSHGHVDWD